jgi:tetratricopeptide (TPR) repeat protein
VASPPTEILGRSAERPARVLVLPGSGGSWMDQGVAQAIHDVLRGREDLQPLELDRRDGAQAQAFLAAHGPAALARARNADLALLPEIQVTASGCRLRLRAWGPGDRRPRALLDLAFAPQDFLDAEATLRRVLSGRLGLPDPVGAWGIPSRLESRKAYLQARALAGGDPTPENAHTAVAILRKVLAQEPGYAPAHVLLSNLLSSQAAHMAHHGDRPCILEDLGEARREAERALEINPADPGAHEALSTVLRLSGDLDGAECSALQALNLDPLSPAPHLLLARVQGRRRGLEAFQSALGHLGKAASLAPGDPRVHLETAQLRMEAGQASLALQAAERALVLQPDLEAPQLVRSDALLWEDRVPEAERVLRAALQQLPYACLLKRNVAYAAFLGGNRQLLGPRLDLARGSWPRAGSTRDFLDGLEDALGRRWPQVARRYEAARERIRRRAPAMTALEKAAASLDLYLMARVLAAGPRPAAALPFLQESEALSPRRLRMAQRDPAFQAPAIRSLLPPPEVWPGDGDVVAGLRLATTWGSKGGGRASAASARSPLS